jgi:hypothetical protein
METQFLAAILVDHDAAAGHDLQRIERLASSRAQRLAGPGGCWVRNGCPFALYN